VGRTLEGGKGDSTGTEIWRWKFYGFIKEETRSLIPEALIVAEGNPSFQNGCDRLSQKKPPESKSKQNESTKNHYHQSQNHPCIIAATYANQKHMPESGISITACTP